jgi:hypothetical protein
MRGERNLQPLADDYVRFARLAEHLLARKSLAVAALVTNSTFLHGHLHRDMRASLASTFPRIEVLDLGGSTRRHARGTRTGRDENVFGVAQGIAVTLFGRAPRLSPAPVRHAALHGARAWKLEQLATPETIAWQPLGEQPASSLPFVPRSIVASEYAAFPSLLELFDFSSVAAKPGDDRHLVAFERDALVPQLEAFRAALRADPSLAKTEAARRVLDYEAPFDPSRVIPYAYRPFDTRFVYDDPRIWTRAVSRLRARIDGEPLLLATRFARDGAFAHVFATRLLPDVIFLSNKTSVNCFAFPRAALRVEAARDALGDAPERNAFFAYLYAILHATRYRERYAPAFAEGFPRIPMPTSRASFDRLAALGERLLALHLDEPVDAPATPTVPDAIRTASARDLACFESFAGASWHARIGGYQVCHKWLLDRARAGRTLDAAERARFASLVRALDATRACIVELDAAVELIAPAWAAAPPSQSA